MIYRFIIVSDEVDDFVREIQIDPEATFLDFHQIIIDSVGYTNDQMTSFFLCDEDWEKMQEVTLEEMDYGSEEDNFVMKDTPISELVEEEKQKLVYVFDQLTERSFFIELVEIIPGKDIKKPTCTRQSGESPRQIVDFDPVTATLGATEDLGENFYGDESFNLDDFDPEGFDIPDDTVGDDGADRF